MNKGVEADEFSELLEIVRDTAVTIALTTLVSDAAGNDFARGRFDLESAENFDHQSNQCRPEVLQVA